MGLKFIVKHFKQITIGVKPQAEIAVIRVLNRPVVTGVNERMTYIRLVHAMPKSRLLKFKLDRFSHTVMIPYLLLPVKSALPQITKQPYPLRAAQ